MGGREGMMRGSENGRGRGRTEVDKDKVKQLLHVHM